MKIAGLQKYFHASQIQVNDGYHGNDDGDDDDDDDNADGDDDGNNAR